MRRQKSIRSVKPALNVKPDAWVFFELCMLAIPGEC